VFGHIDGLAFAQVMRVDPNPADARHGVFVTSAKSRRVDGRLSARAGKGVLISAKPQSGFLSGLAHLLTT